MTSCIALVRSNLNLVSFKFLSLPPRSYLIVEKKANR